MPPLLRRLVDLVVKFAAEYGDEIIQLLITLLLKQLPAEQRQQMMQNCLEDCEN